MKWLINENKIREMVEPRIFGVCTYIGKKIGLPSSVVRLYFIYITFIAFWSPVIVYMFLAFWINIKDYLKAKIHPLLR